MIVKVERCCVVVGDIEVNEGCCERVSGNTNEK